MLWEALIIGIIVGWYRKGSLENIAYAKVRFIPLVFMPFLLKFALDYAAGQQIAAAHDWTLPVHLLSYLLVFIFIFLNWNIPGMKFFALGSLLNLLVVAFNQGTMPVDITRLGSDLVGILQNNLNATHSIMGPETKLPFLGDVIYLSYPRPRKISPGDIVLSVGLLVFLVNTMTTRFMYRVDMTRSYTPVFHRESVSGRGIIRSLKSK